MTIRRRTFSVGGCVYRNMVHIAHASSVAMLVRESVMRVNGGPVFAAFDYLHTSDLFRGRCEWLRRQIRNPDLYYAISVDSDSEFDGPALLTALSTMVGSNAIGVVPMFIGGTPHLNVNGWCTAGEERLTRGELAELFTEHEMRVDAGVARTDGTDGAKYYDDPHYETAYTPISSGGFGVAVFNLVWFRRFWSDPYPEIASGSEHGNGGDDRVVPITVGEDIAFCQAVNRRMGKIAALRVNARHVSVVTTTADVESLEWGPWSEATPG